MCLCAVSARVLGLTLDWAAGVLRALSCVGMMSQELSS
jgi:hypothetical protein